jgi:hypothetical protein
MSFFLAEIKALELDKHNKQLVENLVRSFSCISEEERDASTGGESHDSGFSTAKEVDLYLIDYGRSLSGNFITVLNKYHDYHNLFPKSRYSEIPFEPPEA